MVGVVVRGGVVVADQGGGGMSDMRWRVEGIENAERLGGVTLEVYRAPGFAGGLAVRRSSGGTHAEGFEVAPDPDPYEDED